MFDRLANDNGAGRHDSPTAESPESVRDPVQPERRRLRTSTVAIGATLGGLFGLAVTLGVLLLFFRGSAPPLTAELLEAAEAKWESAGITDYDLELELVGTQAGKIVVEVRDGEVARMVRNGYQPSQRRTWSYWSVPGQLETIAIDLESAKHPEQGFGVAPGTRAVLRAEFDPKYGFPRFYQRILLGTGIHVEWTTTKFEIVQASS